MIVRARVDQPFTLPRSIRALIIKNIDVIKPFFNKSIINVDGLPKCALYYHTILRVPELQALVDEIEAIIKNMPFEAYCLVRTDDPDSIKTRGIKLFTPYLYRSAVRKLMPEDVFGSQGILRAEFIIQTTKKEYFELPFFMPLSMDYTLLPEYKYYGGPLAEACFKRYMPEVFEILENIKTLVLVKCIIRYGHFNDEGKYNFILELIKYYGYEALFGYKYNITFSSTCTKPILPNRILETTIL